MACPALARQSGHQGEGDRSVPSRSATQWERETMGRPLWCSVGTAGRKMRARRSAYHSASLNLCFLLCTMGMIRKRGVRWNCDVWRKAFITWGGRHASCSLTKRCSLGETPHESEAGWKCREGLKAGAAEQSSAWWHLLYTALWGPPQPLSPPHGRRRRAGHRQDSGLENRLERLLFSWFYHWGFT